MLPTSLPGAIFGGMTAARPTSPRAARRASVGIDAASSGVRPPRASRGASAQPSGTQITYFTGSVSQVAAPAPPSDPPARADRTPRADCTTRGARTGSVTRADAPDPRYRPEGHVEGCALTARGLRRSGAGLRHAGGDRGVELLLERRVVLEAGVALGEAGGEELDQKVVGQVLVQAGDDLRRHLAVGAQHLTHQCPKVEAARHLVGERRPLLLGEVKFQVARPGGVRLGDVVGRHAGGLDLLDPV